MSPAKATAAHIRASHELIARALALAPRARAVVLGCGACGELPLPSLAQGCQQVDFVDLDVERLAKAKRRWAAQVRMSTGRPSARRLGAAAAFVPADLTGLVAPLARRAEALAREAAGEDDCLRALARLLSGATPAFWRPPHGEPYGLVICSLLLTQLQGAVRGGVERAFLHRFPRQAARLAADSGWRDAAWAFARRLEDGWIEHLAALGTPGAVVYLADTVYVGWLDEEQGRLTTRGFWVATRTSRLADYLRPWEPPLAEEHWRWLRLGPEDGFAGRLYGVQGLIYRTARRAPS